MIFISMRQFIKKLLREQLGEAEYNYHYGGDVDTDNPRPHGSDTVHGMSGRGTGHFGSGLYFSTYKCHEKTDADDKYGEYSDFEMRGGDKTPELIRVAKGLYRVDMDLYKNLYRVTSNNHGDILFKTMRQTNDLLYWAKDDLLDGKVRKGLSNYYIKLEHNYNQMGLELPPYREFLEMMQVAAKDVGNYKEATSNASFSTRIMEFNGFNGVNVSGIPRYDNTTHGSVIYDMSKVSSEVKKVKNPDMFCKVEYGVAGDNMDVKTRMLRGEEMYDWGKFEQLPQNEQLKLMKRYMYFSPTSQMSDKTKDLYFKTLGPKMKTGEMKGKMSAYDIQDMIDNGYRHLIYDPNAMVNGKTFLEFVLDEIWRLSDDYVEHVKMGINRELSPSEKEALEYL